jgi:hypothetical protein
MTRIIQNNITDPTSNATVARNAERFSMEEAVRIQTQDVRIQTTAAMRRYATIVRQRSLSSGVFSFRGVHEMSTTHATRGNDDF